MLLILIVLNILLAILTKKCYHTFIINIESRCKSLGIYEYIQKQFSNEFSKSTIHAIRAMFDFGYEQADYMYNVDNNNNCLISTDIGKDIWADILRAGIAASAKFFCKKGILPFEFYTKLNSSQNSHHIELHHSDKILYVARIDYASCIPTKALYRPTYNDIQENLFYPSNQNFNEINVFVATYGDNGKHYFQYGNIGILGENSWLLSSPLERGAYRASKSEQDDVLVSINEEFKKSLEKDENNGGTE